MGSRARCLVMALLAPVLSVAVVWCTAALWLDGPSTRWMAGVLAIGFPASCVALVVWLRPFRYGVLSVLAAVVVAMVWWFSIPARNDRDWMRDVVQLPTATVEGSKLTIRNVRNFDYRTETDWTEHWETRTYDLDKLTGVDIFFCYWGPTLIAHTIMSWDFADGPPLAASIETRKRVGQSYSAVRGFFRQYELYYVMADERDVVRLRTNYRVPGEHLFLYRLKAKPAAARALLLSYVKAINGLAVKPRWYNALTESCTTAIRHHVEEIHAARRFDWRILANGKGDQMLYEQGRIDRSLPFEDLRRRSEITEKAQGADKDPDFSRRIREGLPGAR